MKRLLALGLALCFAAQAQILPTPTELPSQPFFVKHTYLLGGKGDWNYLALDPTAQQLFVAHSKTVQVVDVETGSLAAEIGGLSQAYSIALDSGGKFGYISDSRAGDVKVFDRQTFQLAGTISVFASPQALAFEPQTGLLFAMGASVTPPSRASYPCGVASKYPHAPNPESIITVIDTERQIAVAGIEVCGTLGLAQADSGGFVYVTLKNTDTVLQLDAPALHTLFRQTGNSSPASRPASNARTVLGTGSPVLDWKNVTLHGVPKKRRAAPELQIFGLGPDCHEPRGLAIDTAHSRLFAGCGNVKLAVLNTDTGDVVTTLPVGPGTDTVGYDPARGLIYTANGWGAGTLTIIRRDVNDSYAVVQNLPTLPNARTLAVDSSSGLVYLVTAVNGVKTGTPPVNGIGTLQVQRIDATFQVLVVGN